MPAGPLGPREASVGDLANERMGEAILRLAMECRHIVGLDDASADELLDVRIDV
jgi:hypothetical protein